MDIITGEGLDAALNGVDAIVDAATGSSPEQGAATAFFVTAAKNLQAVGSRAGVQRIVAASIIGTDRFAGGYGAAKVAHEEALLAGPIPVRILRAAQFHEFVGQLIDWGRDGDVSYVQQMRTQLVAARTVAEALADLATEPEGAGNGPVISEIAGPREESLVEAAKLLAARRGEALAIEGVSDPADHDAKLGRGRPAARPRSDPRRPDVRGVARGRMTQGGDSSLQNVVDVAAYTQSDEAVRDGSFDSGGREVRRAGPDGDSLLQCVPNLHHDELGGRRNGGSRWNGRQDRALRSTTQAVLAPYPATGITGRFRLAPANLTLEQTNGERDRVGAPRV